MIDEGYIKFNCTWQQESLTITVPEEMKVWRDQMYQLNLIGHDDIFNVGYGNISMMIKDKMLISGTQTGKIVSIDDRHFTIVDDYSVHRNWVNCRGEIKASSESMTHLAIYQADKSINAIIHIHNKPLWQKLLNKLPTTDKNIPYGTPEMALEIKRLFRESKINTEKIIVMAGHEDGIITFGKTMDEAGKTIKSIFEN